MFHLSNDTLNTILSPKDEQLCSYIAAVVSRIKKQYKPLFFKSYSNSDEFVDELFAPVLDPLTLLGMASGGAVATLIAITASLGSLLVAGTAALFMNTKVRDAAFDFASLLVTQIGVGLLTAACSLFLAIVSIPYNLISLVTRSATTLINSTKEQSSVIGDNLEHEPTYSYA